MMVGKVKILINTELWPDVLFFCKVIFETSVQAHLYGVNWEVRISLYILRTSKPVHLSHSGEFIYTKYFDFKGIYQV